MAVRESGVRSVMHAYTDMDGVPTAADASLLTELLRNTWGFSGTVVADDFGVAFLKNLHGVTGSLGEAAAAALTAGVDVELHTVHAFGEHLITEIEAGRLPVSMVDLALHRVLVQKIELGLLDPDWSAVPAALQNADQQDTAGLEGSITLDTEANRKLAARIAEESIVLASNNGILPLHHPGRIAVVGPNADTAQAFLGCYSFPAHVGGQHPGVPVGIELPTVAQALRAEFPDSRISVTAAAPLTAPPLRDSTVPLPPPPRPTWSSLSWATAPGSSDGEPAVKAATRNPWCFRESSSNCWTG
ncbi:glycoside hydrolase family 3 N-terminal domain-containing protein [Pseudarthrobacter sp. MDT1-22]